MKKLKELLEKRYIKFLFLAVSGVMTGLTVCYPVVGMLEWASLIPAALVFYTLCDSKKHRLRGLYCYGLFFFMCYFVTTWHWFFVMYPMSYTGMSKLAALSVLIAAVLGLPFLQSSTFAFVFVLGGLVFKGGLNRRFRLLSPFVFAALWTVFEWTQTQFWFGVPWGRLAIGQTKVLVTAQTASWFGCYFITFLLVAVNFLLAYTLYNVGAKRLFVLTAAGIFSLNALSGGVLMLTDHLRDSDETVTVAAIQGNISSTDKWGSDWFTRTSEIYSELTRQAASEGAKIVVWPETVLPVFMLDSPLSLKLVKGLAAECDITLLVGAVYENDDGKQYNTIFTILPDGSVSSESYSKQHLVPFGEYIPWEPFITALIPALGEINMLDDNFYAGEESNTVLASGVEVGSAVCFDSIYEGSIRNSVRNGAEIIAIESNDSWFFDSAAVHMHLAQAQLRAIENRRTIVRSANTGISALITPNGQLYRSVDALEVGYVLAAVSPRQNKTLYTSFGNVFVLLSAVFIAATVAYDVTVRIKARNKTEKTKGEKHC